MEKKKLICIVGATASGKTSLGVYLAKKFSGEIVSADSRQVYRRLDIGTGKEGLPNVTRVITNSYTKLRNYELETRDVIAWSGFATKQSDGFISKQLSKSLRYIDSIPQWLIDICEPEEDFNMFRWLELAKIVIDDIWARGKVPIIVGGTGLYVQALIEGFKIDQKLNIKNLSRVSPRDKNDNSKIKSFTREELDTFDLIKLQQLAKQLSTKNYNLETIDINNPRRLIRFIERAQAGEIPQKSKTDFDYILIGYDLPREELYAKIDSRVEEWFRQGFYEEVEGLISAGVSVEWFDKIGLEYKILSKFISNLKTQKLVSSIFERSNPQQKSQIHLKDLDRVVNKSLNNNDESLKSYKLQATSYKLFLEMKQEMKWKIHQYARRQLIWWRRFEVYWVKNNTEAKKLAKDFITS